MIINPQKVKNRWFRKNFKSKADAKFDLQA